MKAVTAIALLIGCVILGYLFSALGVIDWVDNNPGSEIEPYLSIPTYLSFVTVLLTAITVCLAILAIGIGLVAAYTINSIKKEAIKLAEDQVKVLASPEAIQKTIERIAYSKSRDTEDLE